MQIVNMVARVPEERFNNPVFQTYGEPDINACSELNEPRRCLAASDASGNRQVEDAIWLFHSHLVAPHQSTSILIQRIRAPVSVVWSIVRRFDTPQLYKCFVRSCVMTGDGKVGSMRHITVVSGLPASSSTERLEILDDETHIISFKIVGGEHRLRNYRSITTLHEDQDVEGNAETLVIESYVVDTPEGNTMEETRMFADTLVRCNLQSLSKLAEHLASFNKNAIRAAPAELCKMTV